MRLLFLAVLSLLCTCARGQNPTESIRDFRVEVAPRQDGTLEVTETLVVSAAGDQIKRGITRALHRRPLGDDSELGPFSYEVVSVTRNGNPEPFQLRKRDGLPTIFIGDKDVFLDPGTYTYVVRYRTADQVYAVGQTDEIRWPLESNGSLPVQAATVTIRLPGGPQPLQSACYTGTFGSRAEDCRITENNGTVAFTLTRPLAPGEGMTVATSVPAGYFTRPVPPPPPTPFERHAVLYIFLLGLGIAGSYAYRMWRAHGVDPRAPEKLEFYPPKSLSPASTGLLYGMTPAHAPVTASLTALAIGGFVRIEEVEHAGFLSTTYSFTIHPTEPTAAESELPAEQQLLLRGIRNRGKLELKGEYDKKTKQLTDEHNTLLQEINKPIIEDGRQFIGMLNLGLLLLGTVAVALYFLIQHSIGGGYFAIGVFSAVLLFGLYGYLIQQPSLEKVKLKNHIRGLRKYLDLPEKKRKNLSGAPDMTETYFQSLLPYAIALGVRNDWAEDLAKDLANATVRDQHTSGMAALPFLLPGFGDRLGANYAKSSLMASNDGGIGGGGFAGGGGSVGGGGGTGGW